MSQPDNRISTTKSNV